MTETITTWSIQYITTIEWIFQLPQNTVFMPGCAVLQLFINRHLLDGHILHINKFRLLYKADTQAHKPLSTHFHKHKLTFSPSLSLSHISYIQTCHTHTIFRYTMTLCIHACISHGHFFTNTHTQANIQNFHTHAHTHLYTHTLFKLTRTHTGLHSRKMLGWNYV